MLVTGATGYVGGRLVPRLLDAGYSVRCLARSARKLADRQWIGDPRVQVIEADLSSPDSAPVIGALSVCQAAYYLVHSMISAESDHARQDVEIARRFADAAERAAVERIIYLGGPGLRRGRRDPHHVAYGEALDSWRVTGIQQDRRLSLRAEMKLPGEALLEFHLERTPGTNTTTLTQTARFLPRGLFGLAYWYGVLPFHGLVFSGMLRGIRTAAEERVQRFTTIAPHARRLG